MEKNKNGIISVVILFFCITGFVSCGKEIVSISRVQLCEKDTTKNYYMTITPKNHTIEACMILFPGFGETAEDVLKQTSLPRMAAQKGITTIIPVLQDGILTFGFDPISQTKLDDIIKDAYQRYNLYDKKLFIGGFSMGGTTAVKYAERTDNKPNALFAIDSPLDIERFFLSNHRDIRVFNKDKDDEIYKYLENRIIEIMGGTPEMVSSNYRNISPFTLSDTTQASIRTLVDIPVRVYIEPNMQWWLKERNTDCFGQNIIDCSAFINQLTKLGNTDAELIISEHKGYRKPDNIYHPHSWTIVDNKDLLNWLLNCK